MIARPTPWVVSAILLFVVAGGALVALTSLALLSGPTTTAQVNVPYSSAITATGGTAPYTYAIVSGALPPGLNLADPNTGVIAGTPTTAGTFTFTAQITDAPLVADSLAAARRGTLAQSGNHAASITPPAMSITVSATPVAAAGAPTSVWTLCIMMAGLAGLGFFRLRHVRRT